MKQTFLFHLIFITICFLFIPTTLLSINANATQSSQAEVAPGLYTNSGKLVYDWETLEKMDYVIISNHELISVDQSLTGTLVMGNDFGSVKDYALSGCLISSIIIPQYAFNLNHTTFSNCPNLKNICVDSKNKLYNSKDNCNGIVFTKTNELMIGFDFTTIPNNVETIMNDAYNNCQKLTKVHIPRNIKVIGGRAFKNCTNLSDVTIEDGVVLIQYDAFNNCTSLKTITIPDSVREINTSAFSGCKDIIIRYNGRSSGFPWGAENATLVNTSTPKPSPPPYNENEALEELEKQGVYQGSLIGAKPGTYSGNGELITDWDTLIKNGDLAYNATTGQLYYFDRNFTGTLVLSDDITNITPPGFEHCILKGLVISKSVEEVSYAFVNCNKLERIEVAPDNPYFDSRDNCNAVIQYNNLPSDYIKTYGSNACRLVLACNTTIIPTSVTTIDNGSFCSCKKLTSIVIPDNILNIGNEAFYMCKNLETIYCNNVIPGAPWECNAKVLSKDGIPLPTAAPIPTKAPTMEPTTTPTKSPTMEPTTTPTKSPTMEPTIEPTTEPSSVPTLAPDIPPTPAPIIAATPVPTGNPNIAYFIATSLSKDTIKLTWNGCKGLSGYKLYRSKKENSNYSLIASLSSSQTTYQDKKCVKNTKYYYRITGIPTGRTTYITKSTSATTHYLSTPKITLKKGKTKKKIKYLGISLKKYEGTYLQLMLKKDNGNFISYPLRKNKIKSLGKSIKLSYKWNNATIYVKIRTYTKKKGKKYFSNYSDVRKISL